MAELKPGGLAMVYGLRVYKRHNGKSAKLLESEIYNGRQVWICEGDFDKTDDLGVFYPKNLMPIDGSDFQHEGDHRKELTHG